MRIPKPLQVGDTIGICAPSFGVTGPFEVRLDFAKQQLQDLGYHFVESLSVRKQIKCASADALTRAAEFMFLYLDESISAVFPPWGGEILMDMLPYLDYEKIKQAPPKWVIGYSDISTLLIVLALKCDLMTVHGPALLDFGSLPICQSDLMLFDALRLNEITQYPLIKYQKDWNPVEENPYSPYNLTEHVKWSALKETKTQFKGRLIGGCLDVISNLIGTEFLPIAPFLETYKEDGIIWYLESCEMNAADLYRTLWQMNRAGYFKYCQGVLMGRLAGFQSVSDFGELDALSLVFDAIPVLYDIDLGHLPPQLIFLNGAYATVTYENHEGSIVQTK